MNKSLSQEQFGKNAAHYLTSTPHATGKSLQRLVDLTSPQKSWRVLDIASGRCVVEAVTGSAAFSWDGATIYQRF